MRVCVERDIELDICDRCNGVWLDAGELMKLAEAEEPRRWSWKIPTSQETLLTTLHCTRCSDKLLIKLMIKDHVFQGCTHCDSLFIDSKALDNLVSTDEDDQKTTLDCMAGGIVDALLTILFS